MRLKRIQMLSMMVMMGLLAACQSWTVPEELHYRDPDLGSEKVAVLSTHGFDFPNWVAIEFVDGKNILRMDRWEQVVRVLPGNHEIGAVYTKSNVFSANGEFSVNIVVEVEAGHRYQLRGRKSDELIRVWLEDEKSKDMIGVGTVFDASGS